MTGDDDDVLRQLEAMAGARPKPERWLIWLGYFTRVLLYICVLASLLLIKPDNITSTPIGALTLNDIFYAFLWGGCFAAILWLVFNPSKNQDRNEGWGIFGLLIFAAAAIYFLYTLYFQHRLL